MKHVLLAGLLFAATAAMADPPAKADCDAAWGTSVFSCVEAGYRLDCHLVPVTPGEPTATSPTRADCAAAYGSCTEDCSAQTNLWPVCHLECAAGAVNE